MNGVASHLARFAGALRAHGVRVGLSDELDAAAALPWVDPLDRGELHLALRVTLKVPHDAWPTFDLLFDRHFGGAPAPEVPTPWPVAPRERGRALPWRLHAGRVQLAAVTPEPDDDAAPGYSPDEVLRHKPFDRISQGEVAAMERLLIHLATRLAVKRSRRLVPIKGRGCVDLRRTLRRTLGTQGECLDLAHRARARDQPKIVLLYDTSGSMDGYTRFHLAFAFALRRTIRRLEIFVFNTALTRVSRAVAPARIAQSLEQLAADVPDWSGGTRLGACLGAFVSSHGSLIGRDTTVVIVSDGLDTGATGPLAAAMRALRERARILVWLNPLLGDPRYLPEAAGMRAALPYVDHFVPGHDLASLEQLTRLLG